MIQNHLIGHHKLVLFIDHVGHEKKSQNLIASWLTADEQTSIVDLSTIIPNAFKFEQKTETVPAKLLDIPTNSHIIIHISRLVQYFKLGSLFRLIEHYRKRTTKQIFTWVTVKCINDTITIPSLENMANVIVTITDEKYLQILTKKSGGTIVRKFYQYEIKLNNNDTTTSNWYVEEMKYDLGKIKSVEDTAIDPESLATFKINVDGEEELIARNALKLPYEHTDDVKGESKIIYNPDSDDDFDDEDPDEDLYI